MNKLIEFIANYKKTNPTGWRKWLLGAVVGLATLLVLVVYAVQASLRTRELANLRRERDKATMAALSARVDQSIAIDEKAKQDHRNAANAAIERERELSAKVADLLRSHEERKAAIDSIRSWDDVDKVVR
jgi:flagellar biosynthesis/type III secretory pathway M-ring protein FliF/YscJ